MTQAVLDEVEVELAREVRQLALDMVRLEAWAREAAQRHRWIRVGELHAEREEVRACRSAKLRELWMRRTPR